MSESELMEVAKESARKQLGKDIPEESRLLLAFLEGAKHGSSYVNAAVQAGAAMYEAKK